MYSGKIAAQARCRKVSVCLEHSSCVEPKGGRDNGTGLPQAKKYGCTLAAGHNRAAILSAAWHRHVIVMSSSSRRRRLFMPSMRPSVVRACMQACRFVNRLITLHQHLKHASRRRRLRRDEHCGSCGCTYRGMRGRAARTSLLECLMNQTMHVGDMARKQLQAEQHGGEARRADRKSVV